VELKNEEGAGNPVHEIAMGQGGVFRESVKSSMAQRLSQAPTPAKLGWQRLGGTFQLPATPALAASSKTGANASHISDLLYLSSVNRFSFFIRSCGLSPAVEISDF
jgi:hypothetical protein